MPPSLEELMRIPDLVGLIGVASEFYALLLVGVLAALGLSSLTVAAHHRWLEQGKRAPTPAPVRVNTSRRLPRWPHAPFA